MSNSCMNQLIKNTVRMAYINLSEEESEYYGKSLNKILDMVAILNTVDDKLASLSPMGHPLEIEQRLREDKANDLIHAQEFLSIASETKDNYYLVPQVISNS